MTRITDSDLVALLRQMANHHHVMRLQDGTLRLLPYKLPAPWGDIVSPDLVRVALTEDFIRPSWAPEGCRRYQISQLGLAYLVGHGETV
ncbi:MAG: hypothetical protein CFE29_03790 [Bradyrhizobiaceae bacterium PARB1]|jgi:hypothetical protein|nr:MAG: hypothetical protein CFE29_03790 [Bradyrhizobiaceae bacterium PARB1]